MSRITWLVVAVGAATAGVTGWALDGAVSPLWWVLLALWAGIIAMLVTAWLADRIIEARRRARAQAEETARWEAGKQ